MEAKEEKKEEKKEEIKAKKKSPVVGIVIVVIVVLLMLASLICGYLLSEMKIINNAVEEGEKKEKNNKTSEKEESSEQIVYDVTDETVSNLIERYRVGLDCSRIEIFTNDKKVKANDISNDIAYEVVIYNKYITKEDAITVEELTKEVQKYFGKDYKFNPDSLKERKGACISHYYDKENKQFVYQETACGGTCGPRTSYKLTKAVEKDGILELNAKVIFASWDKGKEGYYSNYQKTEFLGGFDAYNEFLYEKGSTYKFTFNKVDGNYVFVSSEPVK